MTFEEFRNCVIELKGRLENCEGFNLDAAKFLHGIDINYTINDTGDFLNAIFIDTQADVYYRAVVNVENQQIDATWNDYRMTVFYYNPYLWEMFKERYNTELKNKTLSNYSLDKLLAEIRERFNK